MVRSLAFAIGIGLGVPSPEARADDGQAFSLVVTPVGAGMGWGIGAAPVGSGNMTTVLGSSADYLPGLGLTIGAMASYSFGNDSNSSTDYDTARVGGRIGYLFGDLGAVQKSSEFEETSGKDSQGRDFATIPFLAGIWPRIGASFAFTRIRPQDGTAGTIARYPSLDVSSPLYFCLVGIGNGPFIEGRQRGTAAFGLLLSATPTVDIDFSNSLRVIPGWRMELGFVI